MGITIVWMLHSPPTFINTWHGLALMSRDKYTIDATRAMPTDMNSWSGAESEASCGSESEESESKRTSPLPGRSPPPPPLLARWRLRRRESDDEADMSAEAVGADAGAAEADGADAGAAGAEADVIAAGTQVDDDLFGARITTLTGAGPVADDMAQGEAARQRLTEPQ